MVFGIIVCVRFDFVCVRFDSLFLLAFRHVPHFQCFYDFIRQFFYGDSGNFFVRISVACMGEANRNLENLNEADRDRKRSSLVQIRKKSIRLITGKIRERERERERERDFA